MYKLQNSEIAKIIIANENPKNNKDYQAILVRILNKLGDTGKSIIAKEFDVNTVIEDHKEYVEDFFGLEVDDVVTIEGTKPTMNWGADLDLIQETDPDKIIAEAIEEYLDSCGESVELAVQELITLGYGEEWIDKLYKAVDAWKESR